jgi:hypothetical protein
MTVLSYFDPMNFAVDIRCPTLVGLGLKTTWSRPPPSTPSLTTCPDRARSCGCQ